MTPDELFTMANRMNERVRRFRSYYRAESDAQIAQILVEVLRPMLADLTITMSAAGVEVTPVENTHPFVRAAETNLIFERVEVPGSRNRGKNSFVNAPASSTIATSSTSRILKIREHMKTAPNSRRDPPWVRGTSRTVTERMMSKKSENQSNEPDGGPLPGAEGADTDGELIDLDLADAEGMKLALERCEALHSSASGMLARRKCELLDVRAERRLRTARVRSDLRLKGIKNDMEIQDALTLDPQHREVSAHERMLEAEVITLEAEVERQEKRWDTISRSAELRRQEIQLHRGPFVPGLKGGRK